MKNLAEVNDMAFEIVAALQRHMGDFDWDDSDETRESVVLAALDALGVPHHTAFRKPRFGELAAPMVVSLDEISPAVLMEIAP